MPEVFGGILCAGFGTRLKPITEVVPKPLVPFLNTPIVAYPLQNLRSAGIERVGLNLHHLADLVPPVVDKLALVLGVKPVYSREWEILGTGGGIRGIWEALGEPEGTLVVLNGDSVSDIDLAPHIEAHHASGADVTLVIRAKTVGQPGRVFVGQGKGLAGIRDYRRPGASGLTEYEFTGVHILSHRAISRLELEPSDVVDELYGPMVQADEVIGVSVAEGCFWAALDNPRLVFDATKSVLDNPEVFGLAPLGEAIGDKLHILRKEEISGESKVSGPLFLGMNVKTEANAFVGPYVVMDGVEVASGAKVKNAILYGMGRIEGEWENCLAVAGKVVSIPT